MPRTAAAPITTLPGENKKNIYIIGPRSSGKTTFLGALLSITKYSQNINPVSYTHLTLPTNACV